jgi:hypothetical protein
VVVHSGRVQSDPSRGLIYRPSAKIRCLEAQPTRQRARTRRGCLACVHADFCKMKRTSVHVIATIVLALNGADLSSEALQVGKTDMPALGLYSSTACRPTSATPKSTAASANVRSLGREPAPRDFPGMSGLSAMPDAALAAVDGDLPPVIANPRGLRVGLVHCRCEHPMTILRVRPGAKNMR